MKYTLNDALKLLSSGKLDEALYILISLSDTTKSQFEVDFYTGLIYLRQGLIEKAIISFENANNINTGNFETIFNLGIANYQLKNYDKALEFFLSSQQINQKYNELNINIADCYMNLGQFKNSIKYYNIALLIQPHNITALINKGICLKKIGNYKSSIKYYKMALEIDNTNNDAHWNLSIVLLMMGKLSRGFNEFEYRKFVENKQVNDNFSIFNFPQLINLNNIENKIVIVYPEQGFGDNIQMFRYIQLLAKYAKKVYYVCYTQLQKLFTNTQISIISYNQISLVEKNISCCVNLLSLPAVFKTTKRTIPQVIPFNIEKIEDSNDFQNYKIGISWQGEKNHQDDINRSIKIDAVSKIIKKFPEYTFYSLQLNEDISSLKIFPNFIDCSNKINDFYDTAKIIQTLDLVITIDSAVAHLSASMNKPTWILLPYIPDWRWGLKSKKTKWYPAAKLYRQKEYQNWDSVIKKIISDLKKRHSLCDLSKQTGQKKQIS